MLLIGITDEKFQKANCSLIGITYENHPSFKFHFQTAIICTAMHGYRVYGIIYFTYVCINIVYILEDEIHKLP